MNVRTMKLDWILGPGSLIFLLKPAKLFGQVLRYTCDFVVEEDEARSSSGVLILALGCEISATLEPHLKQIFSPGFSLDPH